MYETEQEVIRSSIFLLLFNCEKLHVNWHDYLSYLSSVFTVICSKSIKMHSFFSDLVYLNVPVGLKTL